MPNAASVGLHKSCGFASVGVFREVGYKFGDWHRPANRAGDRALMRQICCAELALDPALAAVRPDDADPERYRYAQETLAWARGEEVEARRLQAAAPDDGYAAFLGAARGDHGRAFRAWNNAVVRGEGPAADPEGGA